MLSATLLTTLLLLAGLLLSALLLLAGLLLSALLLLARLLVRVLILILIHHFLQRWFPKRRSIRAPWQKIMREPPTCSRTVPFQLSKKTVFGTRHHPMCSISQHEESTMGRYLLLWLLGVPIPILLLIWIFGGLH
ncbi:MAG TPA: hypothetical protein VHT68_18720 [Pseudolabrys sp.]|nr:hypothetical protein [Pseudolabrys sp.]